MAYGRVSVVLGLQSGLGSVLSYYEAIKKGFAGHSSLSTGALQRQSPKNQLSEAEVAFVLNELVQLDRILRREQIEVVWSALGANPRLEIPMLAQAMHASLDLERVACIEDVELLDCDALVYVPLDVQQPKQVEQLARLSMVLPRVSHVAFASFPRWSHSQLMALRESWIWVDPKDRNKGLAWADELIRVNGGLTRKDLARFQAAMPQKEEIKEPAIITRSAQFREVLGVVDAVADSDSTILITGSSGTGKELVAQRVHHKSHRKDQPFVAINCGAIPSELLESELFGHVKGAFTGAVSNREGRFSAAEGGTLFLDEIGEMNANLQVKLLRVLQTRKYEPVGSTKTRAANVRIVAATNRDLEQEVQNGNFREDLFYRLNVIPVHVPALRDRREDVSLLVEYFIRKFNQEKNRRVTGVTRASLRALVAYDWPGNVRELENLMERMVILKSSGMIDVLDFPEKYRRQCLSEIEYEDLVGNGNKLAVQSVSSAAATTSSAPVLTAMVSAVASVSIASVGMTSALAEDNQKLSIEEEVGGEGMIKMNGVFTKGVINQTAEGQDAIDQVMDQNTGSSDILSPSASVVAEGMLTVEQSIRLLADKMVFPVEGLDFNSIVDQFENILILQALERTGWNRNRAAQLLRLNRTTLVEKLKKKQLIPPTRLGNEHLFEGNA